MFCPKCGKEIVDDAVVCVGCGRAIQQDAGSAAPTQKGQAWSKRKMILYGIFSFLLPVIGIVGGIYGLVREGKRKQGATLLILAVLGIAVYLGVITTSNPSTEIIRKVAENMAQKNSGGLIKVISIKKIEERRDPAPKNALNSPNVYQAFCEVEVEFTDDCWRCDSYNSYGSYEWTAYADKISIPAYWAESRQPFPNPDRVLKDYKSVKKGEREKFKYLFVFFENPEGSGWYSMTDEKFYE